MQGIQGFVDSSNIPIFRHGKTILTYLLLQESLCSSAAGFLNFVLLLMGITSNLWIKGISRAMANLSAQPSHSPARCRLRPGQIPENFDRLGPALLKPGLPGPLGTLPAPLDKTPCDNRPFTLPNLHITSVSKSQSLRERTKKNPRSGSLVSVI